MAQHTAVDLHVHTALSPCGGDEMTPPAILLKAERQGLAVIGVVDHNCAGNAHAVLSAAEAFDVRVFIGLEVESSESVHVLALFDDLKAAMSMDTLVADHLPARPNRPDLFGEQRLVNEWGDVTGVDPRLLVAATDLRLNDVIDAVDDRHGLAILAHVDRPMNGLLPVLGFLPPGLRADLLELSRHTTPHEARDRWPGVGDKALLNASDAHYLADIGAGATAVSAALAMADLRIREWGRELTRELLNEQR